MGVVECAKHKLLQPFNSSTERQDSLLQFKFTVLLMPDSPGRITSRPFELALYKSEFEMQDGDMKALLRSCASQKTQKKKSLSVDGSHAGNLHSGHPKWDVTQLGEQLSSAACCS